MKELERDNAGDQQTDLTWQCWMVNTKTGEEKLVTQGHCSEEECRREGVGIFTTKWDIGSYPSSAGWEVIYRQDSPLKISEYWRDYYQEQAKYWNQRYEEVLQSRNQYRQQVPQVEKQERLATQKKLVRRRRVKTGAANVLGYRYKRAIDATIWGGRLFAGSLIWAIALEVIAFVTSPPKDSLYIAQHTTDIPLSIRELFGSKKAPGSIAIGVAEGNLTPSGKPTSIYLGHTDPGNFATNKGFCSWNKAQSISVAEADKRCLEALQTQSVATENQMLSLGLTPEGNKAAIIMATDLWNQSNSAGPMFPFTYKAARDKGFRGRQAYIWARVEAFRNEQQQLDASGLFGICRREPFYQQQLTGLKVDSEAWRWNCIKLDQMRRIVEIEKVLKAGSFCLG
jgi:D-alanyl-D-alanine dipeptidase